MILLSLPSSSPPLPPPPSPHFLYRHVSPNSTSVSPISPSPDSSHHLTHTVINQQVLSNFRRYNRQVKCLFVHVCAGVRVRDDYLSLRAAVLRQKLPQRLSGCVGGGPPARVNTADVIN